MLHKVSAGRKYSPTGSLKLPLKILPHHFGLMPASVNRYNINNGFIQISPKFECSETHEIARDTVNITDF